MTYTKYPDLKDKVVIVTGGTRGIGRAISEAFLENDSYVIAFYKDRFKDASEVATKLNRQYATQYDKFHCTLLDITSNSAAVKMMEPMKYLPKTEVDVLINNAGIAARGKIREMNMMAAREVFEVNVFGLLNMVRAVAPLMATNPEKKSIINIGSTRGHDYYAMPGLGIYGASKAAVIHLTKTLAFELAPIRVNSVSPDRTRTEMTTDPNCVAELIDINNPEDIANMVLFLASDAARTMTGKDIMVGSSIRPK